MMTEIEQRSDIQRGEIRLYQPDEAVCLEIRLEGEAVWLTQAQMAEFLPVRTERHRQSIILNQL